MGNSIDKNKSAYWSHPNPYAARLQHEATAAASQYAGSGRRQSASTSATSIPAQRYAGSGTSGIATMDTGGMRLGSYLQQPPPPSTQPLSPASAPPISNPQSTTTNASRLQYIDSKMKNRRKYNHKERMRARWSKYADIDSAARRNTAPDGPASGTAIFEVQDGGRIVAAQPEVSRLPQASQLTADSYNPFLDDGSQAPFELDTSLSQAQMFPVPTLELLIRVLNNLHNSINQHVQRSSTPEHARTRSQSHTTISANGSEQTDKRRIRLNSQRVQDDLVNVDGAIQLLETVGFQRVQMPSNVNFGDVEPYLYFDVRTMASADVTVGTIMYCVETLTEILNDKQTQQHQYETAFDPF